MVRPPFILHLVLLIVPLASYRPRARPSAVATNGSAADGVLRRRAAAAPRGEVGGSGGGGRRRGVAASAAAAPPPRATARAAPPALLEGLGGGSGRGRGWELYDEERGGPQLQLEKLLIEECLAAKTSSYGCVLTNICEDRDILVPRLAGKVRPKHVVRYRAVACDGILGSFGEETQRRAHKTWDDALRAQVASIEACVGAEMDPEHNGCRLWNTCADEEIAVVGTHHHMKFGMVGHAIVPCEELFEPSTWQKVSSRWGAGIGAIEACIYAKDATDGCVVGNSCKDKDVGVPRVGHAIPGGHLREYAWQCDKLFEPLQSSSRQRVYRNWDDKQQAGLADVLACIAAKSFNGTCRLWNICEGKAVPVVCIEHAIPSAAMDSCNIPCERLFHSAEELKVYDAWTAGVSNVEGCIAASPNSASCTVVNSCADKDVRIPGLPVEVPRGKHHRYKMPCGQVLRRLGELEASVLGRVFDNWEEKVAKPIKDCIAVDEGISGQFPSGKEDHVRAYCSQILESYDEDTKLQAKQNWNEQIGSQEEAAAPQKKEATTTTRSRQSPPQGSPAAARKQQAANASNDGSSSIGSCIAANPEGIVCHLVNDCKQDIAIPGLEKIPSSSSNVAYKASCDQVLRNLDGETRQSVFGRWRASEQSVRKCIAADTSGADMCQVVNFGCRDPVYVAHLGRFAFRMWRVYQTTCHRVFEPYAPETQETVMLVNWKNYELQDGRLLS